MDPCFPDRYDQVAAAVGGRATDDWGDGEGLVESGRDEGVFPGNRASDGEGGAGECGDFLGGGVGA